MLAEQEKSPRNGPARVGKLCWKDKRKNNTFVDVREYCWKKNKIASENLREQCWK